MKIIFVNTLYPEMLHAIFKDINPSDLSYDELLTLINESLCGDSNFYSKNISMYGCNADDIYVNNNLLDKKWENKFKDIRSIPTFFKQIEYYKPDFIYFQNISFLTNDYYNYLKNNNIKIVGQIASPLPANFNHKNYDILISSFPHFVEYFRTLGVTSYYCKLAYEMEVSKLNKINRDITCSFIGSITKDHLERIELLEQLSIYVPEIKIWGKGYDQLPKDSPILKRYQGEVWGKEMFEILSRSQITVNIHINESKNYANNMRLYESTGQGAMLITDYKDNLNDIFNVGEEVIAYRNTSECIKLIKYYVENNIERIKIAEAGKNKTLRCHNYNERMRELKSILCLHLNKKKKNIIIGSNNISYNYIEKDKESLNREYTNSWKDPNIPSLQRALVDEELKCMYRGEYVPPFKNIIKVLQRILKNNNTILEIGCSSGYYAEVFQYGLLKDHDYTGVDYSKHFIKLANEIYPDKKFVIGDGSNLKLPNRSYDIVISSCVILHQLNYEEHINEAFRLADKYVIFFRTPISRNNGENKFYEKCAYGIKTNEIVFSEKKLLKLMDKEFELISIDEIDRNLNLDRYTVTYAYKRKINIEF